jgi:hypothetical protein
LLEVRRSVRQKVVAGAAVAVLLGGVAFAAVSATGARNGKPRIDARQGARRLHPPDLHAAAAYLGISDARLESELRSAGSLAQVARAHAGKSSQGLIEAIVQARRARLAKAAASLPARVGAEVDGPVRLAPADRGAGKNDRGGAPARRRRPLGPFTSRGRLGAAAADYLGIAPARLRGELSSGKTLAQIAVATPGRSSAGLVDALVASRRRRLIAAQAAGRLTPARAARREQRLRSRIGALVRNEFVRARNPG